MTPHVTRQAQRTSATPLAATFALLIGYASLYPFNDWRWPPGQGVLDLMALPWPYWRDRFDEAANLLGYLPLGALLVGAVWRRGGGVPSAAACGVLGPALLSYALEVAQNFLPLRVPSLRDWLLNTVGATVGVALALALLRLGWIRRWQAARERWFVRQSAGALALLLLWPIGLLFPAPLPLGLGQVGDELRELVEAAVRDTPWAEPVDELIRPADVEADAPPLTPLHEGLAVALGLLAPCLVADAIVRRARLRAVMAIGAALLAFAVTTLSTALNFGPDHALTWLTPGTLAALGVGWLAALACLRIPPRLAAGLGLVALTAGVALVSDAPSDPYYAASLQAWEQGRFIRFHGLARWIGWLWPYLAMGWLLARLAARDEPPPPSAATGDPR